MEALCDGYQQGAVYGQRLLPTRKRERLEFIPGLIISCESAFGESGFVCLQERQTSFDAVDK